MTRTPASLLPGTPEAEVYASAILKDLLEQGLVDLADAATVRSLLGYHLDGILVSTTYATLTTAGVYTHDREWCPGRDLAEAKPNRVLDLDPGEGITYRVTCPGCIQAALKREAAAGG